MKKPKVSIELNSRAFAFYNPDIKDWYVESGIFEILVGASSRDIRLAATVQVVSTQQSVPAVDKDQLAAYHNFPQGAQISQKAFESLLGRPVPLNQRARKGNYTINTPIGDMKDSFIGRQLHNFMGKQMAEMVKGQEDTPIALLMEGMAREAPLRTLLMAGNDQITRGMLDALLVMINGRFFQGAICIGQSQLGQKLETKKLNRPSQLGRSPCLV